MKLPTTNFPLSVNLNMVVQTMNTTTKLLRMLSLAFGISALCAVPMSAAVIFSDDMNYADTTAMRAAWAQGTSTAGSGANLKTAYASPITGAQTTKLNTLTPVPASGNAMGLDNGVVFRDLGQTVTSSWSLDFLTLQSTYQRGQGVFLLNAAGTQGYGILWDSTTVTTNGGNGSLYIQKFNNSSYTDYTTFGIGTALGTNVSSGHASTGYTVTATPDNVANNATYDTSSWGDFLHLNLTWDSSSGLLTMMADGVQVKQVTDTAFSSFSKIYIRGNTTGYFDSLSVSTAIPEPSAYTLIVGGGVAMGLVMLRRRVRG